MGCKRVEDYYEKNPYFGATVGRYGNRIGGAQFDLNGKNYILEKNDGNNNLHGGSSTSFDRVVWHAEIVGDTLELFHVSPDGAGGFQGKKNYVNHCALCLETQLYPNAPNCPDYPSALLKAGEAYHEITVYKFSAL